MSKVEYKSLRLVDLQAIMSAKDPKFTPEIAQEVAKRLCATLGRSAPGAVAHFASTCPDMPIRMKFRKKILRSIKKKVSKILQSGNRDMDTYAKRLVQTMTLVCEATGTDLSEYKDTWFNPITGFINIDPKLVNHVDKVVRLNQHSGAILAQHW